MRLDSNLAMEPNFIWVSMAKFPPLLPQNSRTLTSKQVIFLQPGSHIVTFRYHKHVGFVCFFNCWTAACSHSLFQNVNMQCAWAIAWIFSSQVRKPVLEQPGKYNSSAFGEDSGRHKQPLTWEGKWILYLLNVFTWRMWCISHPNRHSSHFPVP